jgi:hypothetical protein
MSEQHEDKKYQPEEWIRNAEVNRREKSGQFSTAPVPGVADYGASVAAITNGMHHLTEALANGQELRAISALAGVRLALEDVDKWLAAAIRREVVKRPPVSALHPEAEDANEK